MAHVFKSIRGWFEPILPSRFASESSTARNTSERKSRAWVSADRARRYYDSTIHDQGISNFVRSEHFLDVFQEHLPSGKVLDMGCGPGLVSVALCDRGYEVVALDISEEMLALLREHAGGRAIETRCGDGFAAPAQDGEFDAVISRMYLQHFPNWSGCVSEMARVTRPGGLLFYDFGNAEHWQLAERWGSIPHDYPYTTDARKHGRFYAVASAEEQAEVAERCGCQIEAILPTGFFMNNAVLAASLGPGDYSEFVNRLGEFYRNPACKRFIEWFEGNVVSRFPPQMAYANLTIVRKNG